ncbi:ChaC-like protein [Lutimaribacter pacificus]|uniref:glutathione-specific gamma-glutamylcyclotransferase n=1 Tax=Lutimaribacter pacificus TaxID=391948 RepID=A0A1H0J2T7_9RHOB|nr:gamma-glutamylcyclotransferase family protein [Lutimaribacter pacificus]SDO37671.1 ChaC-like protein [Lutimaribacter pacificus]SHK15010.1 ChaC-like protein [Lutimaribacter pacificus]
MSDAFFFGYGSLVNRATHTFADAHRARVRGWRRAWRGTPQRAVAFLTAVPDPAAQIDGLIAAVPGESWAALDERERAYDRVHVGDDVHHPLPHRPQIAIYAIPDGGHHAPSDDHPILLSYVDVVMQGYFNEFGAEGVAAFLASTDGWASPVMDDRADPIYPRHRALAASERRMVDGALEQAGARRIPLDRAVLARRPGGDGC